MSQAPPETITSAEGYFARLKSDSQALWRFAGKHPTLAISFCYLCASIVGLVHSLYLLGAFKVDALTQMELLDFILGAVHQPIAFAYIAGGVLGFYLAFLLNRGLRRRFPRYARASDKHNKTLFRINPWLAVAFLALLYLSAFIKMSALDRAKAIREDQTPHYQVTAIYPIAGGPHTLTLPRVQLVAATSRYLWLYADHKILMLPYNNIASLIPLESEVKAAPEKAAQGKAIQPKTPPAQQAKTP
ncbi:hypothetical protein PVT67_16840 [Gallaecimonas kandeliae]|uniref:hypothetical protein n=1 Tax=Gallaecimonas kandeliae TaxID=3029055 RepID=UPI00264902E3|nr:hypothetical protein [Gallaecimonas kandeliae]WKE65310.1 hypothetical protein PVT67_16840 [Gallaecimonas kandeliae]